MRVLSVCMGLVLALILSSQTVQAATLQIKDSVLNGVNGIEMDGKAYDVAFVDGLCSDLYDGCDEDSDFLGLNNGQISYLSNIVANKIASFYEGCLNCSVKGVSSDAETLTIWTPLKTAEENGGIYTHAMSYDFNEWFYAFDEIGLEGEDTREFGNTVFARWTERDLSVVPLPPAFLMFLGAGLVLMRFKKSKAAQAQA